MNTFSKHLTQKNNFIAYFVKNSSSAAVPEEFVSEASDFAAEFHKETRHIASVVLELNRLKYEHAVPDSFANEIFSRESESVAKFIKPEAVFLLNELKKSSDLLTCRTSLSLHSA